MGLKFLGVIFLAMFTAAFVDMSRLGAGWGWDFANGLGFAGFCGLLAQMAGVRAPGSPKLHEFLGYAIIVIVIAHAIWFLASDPALFAYFRPGGPMHIWAGVVALLALSWLIAFSRPADRRNLHPDQASFRRVHLCVSWLALGAGALHVIKSGYYIATLKGVAIFLAVVAGAYVAGRRIPPDATRAVSTPAFVLMSLAAALLFAFARNFGK